MDELQRDYLFQQQNPNLKPKEEQNSFELLDNLFHHKDTADIPSTAVNNSQAISELKLLRKEKNFNLKKLEDQAVLINKILE